MSRWHMNRLGLVDFWCYEDDEFEFQDGHMLLRGSNGSGKSVTMQSFIPLLLDGNRNSERLDPFGTRSRKMDTYLIDENSDRDERIGYLYLEFKREIGEIYTTIGMGLRARKNKPLETWYFVIEDNRRVNIDFSLMENHYTLSKKQLENILGTHQVITSQTEYMRRVNDVLFGFSHIDDYKESIDLLLQLRSPKLSNSLSPNKINEILAKSLQPLSEEDLRPMSEAITNMDNLQDDLENLNISLTAAKKISQAYNIYNKAMLVDKWQKFSREKEKYENISLDIKNKQNEIQTHQNDYHVQKELLNQQNIRIDILKKEKDILSDPNIDRLHDDLMTLQHNLQTLESQMTQKKQQCDLKEDKMIDLKNDLESYKNEIYIYQKEHQKIIKQLEEIYESFPFSEHSVLKETLSQDKSIDFDYTKKCLKEERKKTQELKNLYIDYEYNLKQIKTLEEQLILYNEQINECNDKLEDAKKDYHECVVDYQEFFYHYCENNQVLKLSSETLKEMVQSLEDYEINQDYHSIYEKVHQQYLHILETLTKKSSSIQMLLEQLQQQYDQANQEYQYWLNQTDFEPERTTLTLKQRNHLKELNIPYMPLFQLLDFDEQVSEEQKNIIEETFSQMHILDAIVVEDKYKEQVSHRTGQGHDYYLWTQVSIETLKTFYLKYPFNQEQLYSLFEHLSIITTSQSQILIDNAYFQNGILEGNIDQTQPSSFIGFNRRKTLRENKINQCEETLRQIENNISHQEKIREENQNQMMILKEEMKLFKSEERLKESFNEVEKGEKDIQFIEEQFNQCFEQKQDKMSESQKKFQQIKQQCSYLIIDVSKEAIISREEQIEQYNESLDVLKDTMQKENHYQQLLNIENNKLEELIVDIDNLHYEISISQEEKDKTVGKIDLIHKKLDELGYSDKQKRLQEIDEELIKLNHDIQLSISHMSKIETEEQMLKNTLTQLQEKREKQDSVQKKYQAILDQEIGYGFVIENMDYKALKQIDSQTKMNKSISDYLSNLQSVFFEQVAYLSQYRLTHEIDVLCQEVDDVSGHFIIKANHQGKKIHFYALLNILQEKIESQKLLIMEEDRRIFEEILVNTIGKKIRNHIQSSKRWVEKMERYMRDMNTSSGLQLGLKWRSKKAIDDEELDTQKLVELLEKDYRLLKESDRQKISQHFRSKIENARRYSSDENTTASFHQLMREVMDYREWFEFTLYAKKPNENKKELTNRVFYAYSGGEKAIAMYVPLFSAVAAKFESAREDAPHLIALDEAFAGVDDNNIDSLFELITKFDFDYIMNSQFLWGDYPSCKSLGIYELFRPNNAPFVTKVAYIWNGHIRKVKIS